MFKPVLLSALLIALPAAPALAEEAAGGPRAQLRGGVAWSDGHTDPVLGIATGYDFGLGDHVFLGGEVSGEKILAEDTYVELALTGRLGTSVSGKGSVFLAGTPSRTTATGRTSAWATSIIWATAAPISPPNTATCSSIITRPTPSPSASARSSD